MERPNLDVTSPVRDLGINRDIRQGVDADASDHRHSSVYIGLRLPKRPKRPSRGTRKSREKKEKQVSLVDDVTPSTLSPSEQVQYLLGDADEGEEHESHSIFCQMDQLHRLGGELEWREAARWVKYEEDVEEGGERWSKPHVASLSLHSLFELRSSLTSGCVVLDMDAYHISQVADLLLDNLISKQLLEESMRDTVRNVLLSPHRHQHQKRRRSSMRPSIAGDHPAASVMTPMFRTLSEIGRRFSEHGGLKARADMQAVAEKFHQQQQHGGSSPKMKRNPHSSPNFADQNGGIPESASSANLKGNQHFMRKIPEGAEVANIMVGEVDTLKYQVCALVRLCEARIIGDMSEVPIPTRFLFFILGPPGTMNKMFEIGRSISTILVDQVFREVAYRAKKRQDILAGIDEFLDQVTVLPPGEWDPTIRIEPPASVPNQDARVAPKPDPDEAAEEEEEESSHCDPTLQRSGKIFGGLIADVKRKIPWYASDFKDCLHVQCVASVIYLFLATLTPNVTFGGLLGIATENYMGTMECILSAAITGVVFALFSGQPLNILGSTGPMLVLEMILYQFCRDNHLDFMPFRVWIGLWTAAILIVVVMFDLSALVRYITRFTEESFACLIALIFIYQAFVKLFGITHDYPIHTDLDIPVSMYECDCHPPNSTMDFLDVVSNATDIYSRSKRAEARTEAPDVSHFFVNGSLDHVNWTSVDYRECVALNATPVGYGCGKTAPVADVFFLSILLFIATFAIAQTLTSFKNSRFFPTYVRQTLSDFAVLIAIIVTVVADAWIGIGTPKLMVPEEFKPSASDKRGWIINPMSGDNPWWLVIAAVLPALLATILIFLDQQITAVIVNRKENKLKKGNGYHLDLLVVAVLIAVCSFLGLPWYVAATVSAIAHIMSLKKESECNAPGERPVFLGVREQRVTALMVGLLSGCSVLFTSVLRVIPMAVLYGVFFYMGIAALKGMQFIDRLFILLMPAKYQPDTVYLRHVPIKRVHLFTLIQVGCLACLWVIKTIKAASIVFPIMVLATCFIRKGMDYIFEQRELKWLDDIMPDSRTKDKDDEKKKLEELDEEERLLHDDEEKMNSLKVEYLKPMDKFTGRRGSVDTDRVNISEEMSKTGIWLAVRRDSTPQFDNLPTKDGCPTKTKKKKKKTKKEADPDESPSDPEEAEHNHTSDHNNHANPKASFFIPAEDHTDIMKEIPEEAEDDESKM